MDRRVDIVLEAWDKDGAPIDVGEYPTEGRYAWEETSMQAAKLALDNPGCRVVVSVTWSYWNVEGEDDATTVELDEGSTGEGHSSCPQAG
jgi:hypothetical protein